MDGFSPLNLMKNKRQYITKSKNLQKRTQRLLKEKINIHLQDEKNSR